MKTSTLTLKIILLAGFILSDNPVFSQGKFEMSVGVGFPEMINLKIKYGKDIQIGLCQSLWPVFHNVPIGPTAAEIYYHFAGKSKFTEQPTLYLLGGLGYFWLQEGGIYDDECKGVPFCFYPRIGQSINFSRRMGFNFEAGAFIPFYNTPHNSIKEIYHIYPSISISLFLRL